MGRLKSARGKPCCLILSYDFLDLDVFWNIRLFYQNCGYKAGLDQEEAQLHDTRLSDIDLLVILRGVPQWVHPNFGGRIHLYDYVGESICDCSRFFPNNESVQLISLNQPQETNFRGNHIRAYIPVMPEIWECKKRLPRQHRILHISNYKVMKQDHYQQDLLELALSGMVEVHGSGWSRMGVPTGRISLRQANEKLSRAICCLGLMYSHQRGRTLSGRMWQAPLHGCYVLSERGTNVFSCPGIIEVDSFRLNALVQDPAALSELKQTCETLQAEAHRFWRTATRQLASELGLQLSKRLTPRHLFQARFDLLRQHLDFVGAKELHRWRSYVEILGNVLRRYLRR